VESWHIILLVLLLVASTAVLSSMALHHLLGAHQPARVHRLRRWNQRQGREG